MSDALEEMAFRDIANAHPHEMHEAYPDRFWRYFHERFPLATREQMEELLRVTALVKATGEPDA